MWNVLPGTVRTCEGVSRRNLLQVGTLGGLGLSLPMVLAQQAQAKATSGSTSTPNNCILIWTRGGTSHHDTFDPKPEAPVNIKGEFGVIDTALPGVKFTEVVPRMAQYADRFSLMRSWNPMNGSHGTADQYVMSGRKFNPALSYPTVGAVVSWRRASACRRPGFPPVARTRCGARDSGFVSARASSCSRRSHSIRGPVHTTPRGAPSGARPGIHATGAQLTPPPPPRAEPD